MSSQGLCTIEGCDQPALARTWCGLHYKRMRAHGAPHKRVWKQSSQTIALRRAALLGRRRSEDARARMSAARLGRPAWNRGVKMTAAQRINSGRRPGFTPWNKGIPTGITPMRGHRPEYRGVRFRSNYEVRLARAFDDREVAWVYEPVRFTFPTCSYVPDFYLPDLEEFWEAKGYFDLRSQEKIRLFAEHHPDLTLVLATNDIITMLESGSETLISGEDT